jgi:hypothetical protein
LQFLSLLGIVSREHYQKVRAHSKTLVREFKMSHVFWHSAQNRYLNWCLNHLDDLSNFVPLSDRHFKRRPDDPKVIAYYLPQFYQFPLNDEWFGRGFTEWTNVAKAVPQFEGHYQPRLPIDTGFYNLETTSVMRRQIEMARQYGIYGFCFYYYWFHGERIMEKPIFNFLNDTSLDMPFMLFWANENWTKNWHPNDSTDMGEMKFGATHAPGEAAKFLDGIVPLWNDSRYIKIDGRPALIIYKHNKYPYVSEFLAELKKEAVRRKMAEPYVMLIYDDDMDFSPAKFNADACAEFGTCILRQPKTLKLKKITNTTANLRKICDMESFVKLRQYMYSTDYPIHRGAMVGFDNTARKIKDGLGADIYTVTPELYKIWLSDIIRWTRGQSPQPFVFVSAWNEWAEAMYLEPDRKYGYAYLEATRQALEETRI